MFGAKAMLVSLLLSALAGVRTTTYEPKLSVRYDANAQAMVADNDEPAPYTLSFNFTLFKNAESGCGTSCLVVVPARGHSTLFGLQRKQEGLTWQYQYSYRYYLGDYHLKPDARFVYELPFAGPRRVSQGYNGSFTHQGDDRYSLDFPMPEGTPVYAARAGTVVWVVQKFTEGGEDERLRPFANLIQVMHADGSIAKYVHLRQGGALVKPGQKVVAGQQIGLSGNTGYTTQPHLHFEVRYNHGGEKLESIPTLFKTSEGELLLTSQETYSRP